MEPPPPPPAHATFRANLVNFSNSCSKKSFDSLLLDRRTVTGDPLKVHNLIPINRVQVSSFGFQFFPKGVEVFFEPRTLEKEVINSFHTLFANKASCTFGTSDPGIPPLRSKFPMILT